MTKIDQLKGSGGMPGFVIRGGTMKQLFRKHKVTKAIVAELTKTIAWPGVMPGLKWDKGSIVIVALDPLVGSTRASPGVVVGDKMQGINKTEFKKIRDYDMDGPLSAVEGYDGIAEDVALCVLQNAVLAALGNQLSENQGFVTEFDQLVRDGYYESAVRHVENFAQTLDEEPGELLSNAATTALAEVRQGRVHNHIDENRKARAGRIGTNREEIEEKAQLKKAVAKMESIEDEFDLQEDLETLAEALGEELALVEGMVEQGYETVICVGDEDAEHPTMFGEDDEHAESIVDEMELNEIELVPQEDYTEALTEAMAAVKLAAQIAAWLAEHNLAARKKGGPPVSSAELRNQFHIRPHEADDIIDEIFPKYRANATKLRLAIMKTLLPAQQVVQTAIRVATRKATSSMNSMGQLNLAASTEVDPGELPLVEQIARTLDGDDEATELLEVFSGLQPVAQALLLNKIKEGRKKHDDLKPVYKGQTGAIKDAGFTEAQAHAYADAMGEDFDDLFVPIDEDDETDEGDDKTSYGKSDDKKRRITNPKKNAESRDSSDDDDLQEVAVPEDRAQEMVDACRAAGLSSDTDIRFHEGRCIVRVDGDTADKLQESLDELVTTG